MVSRDFILALDQGTTSSRAMIFDHRGERRAISQQPITQHFPAPGWVNHDPEEIWRTVRSTARDALTAAGLGPDGVAAIGITNQRETTIVWDRATGRPLAPAIVWQSRQSAPWVIALQERGMSETYQTTTGLVPDAYFSATKLAMLLDSEPELRRRAEAGEALFGTIDSWLLWKLTNGAVHATDVSNASRTMLFNLRTLDWSDELLADLAIPRVMLPAVRESSGVFAETAPEVLGGPIPIAGVAGDQHAALFGQACFAEGAAKNTYGTGSFLLMQTGQQVTPSRHRLLTTIGWGIDGTICYALEGAIFVTGAAVQWLRDGLGLIESASEIEALAGSVPDSSGVVFVPALSGLGAPHWDASARGAIFGLSRGTTAAHLARATLEAIAFQTRDVVDAMIADSGIPLRELRVDGGAASNDLLLQIQADILGVSVIRPDELETTALGAAYLAGLGVGYWSGLSQIEQQWREDRRFDPGTDVSTAEAAYQRWLDAVGRSLAWENA